MFLRRTASLILVICTLSPTLALAAGPTKEQCMSANEDATVLRKRGKLAAARTSLQACMVSTCPAVIHDDCSKLLDDVNAATPSLAFNPGEGAAPLTNVTVLVDNEPFADRLDGTPLPVDPGLHEFKFFVPNHDM